MFLTVFNELGYFLLYFAILLAFFAVQISLILTDVTGYENIGPFMWIVMALQTSLLSGDIAS